MVVQVEEEGSLNVGVVSIDPRQADRPLILGVFASCGAINVANTSWLYSTDTPRLSWRARLPSPCALCALKGSRGVPESLDGIYRF